MDQRVAMRGAFARYSRLAGAQAAAAVLGLGLLLTLSRAVDREIAPDEANASQIDGTTWSDWLFTLEVPSVAGNDASVWTPSDRVVDPARPVARQSELQPQEDASRFFRVEITGYTSREEETDADPFLTAMCTTTGPGVIAVSRDLLETFTPGAPFDFGNKVLLPGVGIFRIEDTMHPRWKKRADIWFASLEEAQNWGRRGLYMTKVDDGAPLFPADNPLALNF